MLAYDFCFSPWSLELITFGPVVKLKHHSEQEVRNRGSSYPLRARQQAEEGLEGVVSRHHLLGLRPRD